MARTQKASYIVRNYDKVILIVVASLLLGSLVALVSGSSAAKEELDRFDHKLKRLQPANPTLEPCDSKVFEAANQQFETAYVFSATNNFLVAPERVSCVKCQRPILLSADVCPICGTTQPSDLVNADWDSDGDGMPDEWEKQYGFNPLDPADAQADADGDGFTNAEEFVAKTDPTDPKSHPPRYDFLRVSKIEVMQFPYMFSSKALMRGGAYRFAVKDSTGRDWWVKKGEELSNTGFVLASYTNTFTEVQTSTGKRKLESFALTFKKGEDTVIIRDNKQPPESSVFQVHFYCTKDAESQSYVVKRQESFDFDGISFTLLSINRRENSAVLQNGATGEKLTVKGD